MDHLADKATPILRARFRDREAFLAAYQDQFDQGGLFVATRERIALGSPVLVDIRLPVMRGSVLVRGFVAWRRPIQRRNSHSGPRVRAGVGIEFLPGERRKRDFLLAMANNEEVEDLPRRHRRLPVQVRVQWRVKDERARHSSVIEDIGEGGAFLRTPDVHPVGSPVLLDISPPGSESSIRIQATIAWTRGRPGEEGMGVEFRCRDSGGARRLKEVIRRIEQGQYAPGAMASA